MNEQTPQEKRLSDLLEGHAEPSRMMSACCCRRYWQLIGLVRQRG